MHFRFVAVGRALPEAQAALAGYNNSYCFLQSPRALSSKRPSIKGNIKIVGFFLERKNRGLCRPRTAQRPCIVFPSRARHQPSRIASCHNSVWARPSLFGNLSLAFSQPSLPAGSPPHTKKNSLPAGFVYLATESVAHSLPLLPLCPRCHLPKNLFPLFRAQATGYRRRDSSVPRQRLHVESIDLRVQWRRAMCRRCWQRVFRGRASWRSSPLNFWSPLGTVTGGRAFVLWRATDADTEHWLHPRALRSYISRPHMACPAKAAAS